ncbi:Alpha/Beta hydrolase protein [Phlebopus sp. FC_14]|nr:Alpha/Beta hydrolase protein [Phlebopus sp. FC_14]
MAPNVTRWGDANVAKHALLIHGLTSSSGVWFRIAEALATRGYHVTAPDLLAHGKSPKSTSYKLEAFVEALEPLFEPSQPRFSLVIAHSFGGVVALACLSRLASEETIPVILLDPPLLPATQTPAEQQTRVGVEIARKIVVSEVTEIPDVETLMSANPLWTKEDAKWKILAAKECDIVGLGQIFEQNYPWSFVHLLDNIPPNVKVTILAADPAKHAAFRVESVKNYKHVQTNVVEMASHSIHREFPDLVIDTAMKAVEEAHGIHVETGLNGNGDAA